MKAFAGREFNLPMKDGTVTHCNGQYWDGHVAEAEKVVGEKIAKISARTKEELKRCFVFAAMYISKRKLDEMLEDFEASHPGYEPYEYREYENLLKQEKAAERREGV